MDEFQENDELLQEWEELNKELGETESKLLRHCSKLIRQNTPASQIKTELHSKALQWVDDGGDDL